MSLLNCSKKKNISAKKQDNSLHPFFQIMTTSNEIMLNQQIALS